MTGTLMMDRPMAGMAPAQGPAAAPNMMMVPRCTITVERCAGGMKLTCVCADPAACTMLQNLCTMLAGGMCSVCCVMNGMVVCTCNLTMGLCKCEMTKDGCVFTCTSGDAACCGMIQGCCDCLAACLKAGCTCCVMMNNTPVCCGTC